MARFASPAPTAPSTSPKLAALPQATRDKLKGVAEFTPPSATYPNGTHACEVEIDTDTGAVELVRYTVVDDFGFTLNPLLLAGQVHGGIAQGAGQALTEKAVFDENGQLVTASFMDYGMPRADDFPDFDFETRNIPSNTNPMGLKGAGEAGSIGSTPAVMNAIADALWRSHQGRSTSTCRRRRSRCSRRSGRRSRSRRVLHREGEVGWAYTSTAFSFAFVILAGSRAKHRCSRL